MERVVTLTEVRTFPTSKGNVRYVARDADGNEYTTFRENIGERAKQLQGRRARVEFHQEQRGQYDNTYLDRIEPAEPAGPGGGTAPGADTDPQEAAWRTAVDAAPWLIGEAKDAVPADELYAKLKPFEARVAADIEKQQRDGQG
jgi:hypothetical protein